MAVPWPWLRSDRPVLASGSATRAALLQAAGLVPDIVRPGIDERSVEEPLRRAGFCPADRALLLARAKTCDVARAHRHRVVIGADQTLQAAGHPGTKAADPAQALAHLELLSGRRHYLHAAWCIAIGGSVVAEGVMSAAMDMRHVSADFLRDYLNTGGDRLLQSVGCYEYEGLGRHLFQQVHGDHSTILGLPLQPIFDYLRHREYIAA